MQENLFIITFDKIPLFKRYTMAIDAVLIGSYVDTEPPHNRENERSNPKGVYLEDARKMTHTLAEFRKKENTALACPQRTKVSKFF